MVLVGEQGLEGGGVDSSGGGGGNSVLEGRVGGNSVLLLHLNFSLPWEKISLIFFGESLRAVGKRSNLLGNFALEKKNCLLLLQTIFVHKFFSNK